MVKRAFISFDYDHDSDLKTLLVGQSKHERSPFEIVDASVKDHLPGDWVAKVRGRIDRADLVIVICGFFTDRAHGVRVEVGLAQELAKPYFLLRGRPAGQVNKPLSALPEDKVYNWTWPNLEALIGGAR